MRIRDAVLEDVPAIVEILNYEIEHSAAIFDTEPFQLEERLQWFTQFGPTQPCLVCEDGLVEGHVLGFAYYTALRAKAAYAFSKELTVYIHRDARKRGVGSALYTELIERARSQGVHVLVAVLGGDNPGSVALHEKFGFVRSGHLREVGRKFDQWIDTHYFTKLLSE